MTGGRGRFAISHSHYDPVPAHLVDKVVGAPQGARARLISRPARSRNRSRISDKSSWSTVRSDVGLDIGFAAPAHPLHRLERLDRDEDRERDDHEVDERR